MQVGFKKMKKSNIPKLNRLNFNVPIQLVFLMWLAFSLQAHLAMDFGFLGIFPRRLIGLPGIITGPIIHGSYGHILSNSFPVLFLGATLFYFYPDTALRVFFQCYFMTNLFVWLFARPYYHIGASGLVYALALFLISMGLFKRSLKSIVVSLVVILLYGGLLYNFDNLQPNISYESHAFGAMVGIGVAYSTVFMERQRKKTAR